MINDDVDKDKEKQSILNRYQNNLEKTMKSSDFIFHYVHLLRYN